MIRLGARIRETTVLGSILVGAHALSGQTSPPPPNGGAGAAFAVRGVAVFDGRELRRGMTVIVSDGRIERVGREIDVAEGMATVDGADRTLLPGLIDAHTHTFNADHLREAASVGVTTELDQFTAVTFLQAMHAEQAAGDVTERADLLSGGVLATAPGGHGTEYGMVIPTLTSPADATGFVRSRAEEGSDWLKIIWDDGRTYGRTIPTLDSATVGALIAAAHDDGLLAVVHVATRHDARAAVSMGADVLAHAPHDGPPANDFGEVLARHGSAITPTLTVIGMIAGSAEGPAQLADRDLAPYVAPDMRTTLESTFPTGDRTRSAFHHAARATRLARDAGAVVLAGTDAGNPGTAHGVSLHRELENLVKAGLTPAEALTAATAAPAAVYGLADRGRVAPGLRADLVLVEGDPTADILSARRIVAVWRNGVPIDRDAVRARIARARSAAAAPLPVPGPVSDFDGGEAGVTFGAGWTTSTDAMTGGTSTARITPSDGALRITGEVVGATSSTWAGAMLFTGAQPMAPADVSAARGVAFRARGEPGLYTIMLFARSTGVRPSMKTFDVGASWSEVRFDFADFPGVDPSGLMAVFLGVSGRAGPFALDVDDVVLY